MAIEVVSIEVVAVAAAAGVEAAAATVAAVFSDRNIDVLSRNEWRKYMSRNKNNQTGR
jgi:hypothetical protein